MSNFTIHNIYNDYTDIRISHLKRNGFRPDHSKMKVNFTYFDSFRNFVKVTIIWVAQLLM